MADGLGRPADVAATADGGCVVADAEGHRLWRVRTDGTVVLLAGSGRRGLVDERAGRAQLAGPAALAVGVQGVFVVDRLSDALRVVDRNGRVATMAGPGVLCGPCGVTAAPDGSSVYVADTGNDVLRLWSGVDGGLTTLPIDGLRRPHGIDVLADGRLLVADTGNDRLLVADLAAGTATAIG